MGKEDYEVSGLPRRHKFFRPVQSTNKKWLSIYDKIKNSLAVGSMFAVVGNRGTGKTQLGASLIGYVAFDLDKSVIYRKAFDIFLRVRESYKVDGDSEKKAVDFFVRRYFMVIDAFEVRGNTDFERRTIDHIIDLRYDMAFPTLIISNDTPKGFSDAVGPSIIDRLRETGGIIEMNWDSFRKNKLSEGESNG